MTVPSIHKQADDRYNRFDNRLCRNYALQLPEAIQENYARDKQHGISQDGNRKGFYRFSQSLKITA